MGQVKIVIAPRAAVLPEDRKNAKNWPYWPELIGRLKVFDYEIIQLGGRGETRLDGVDQFICGWPLQKLIPVIRESDLWIAVDTWLSHFCYVENLQPGIVIWSQSDPEIWGHPQNINLIKDRSFLRRYQFAPWWDAEYDERAFVTADEIVEAVLERVRTKAA